MGAVLRAIPLPLRIVAILLLALAIYGVLGSGAGAIFTALAVTLWLLVLLVLAYELGWMNALARVPLLSRFLGFMSNRKAISGVTPGEAESGPRGKLDAAERDALYADAESRIARLHGITAAAEAMHNRLIDIAANDPENPFGTQAPAVLTFFSGPRGVGKTTLAQAAADMMTGLGAIETARIVVLKGTDMRGGMQGTPLEIGRAKAQAALGGTLLIDDADWMLAADPYGTTGPPAADLGLGILEVLQTRPRSTLLVCTLSPEGERKLRTDPVHARWLGKLALRSVALTHLDDDALLAVTLEQLDAMGWAVSDDATETALRRSLSDLRDRMGADFDNAEACRRFAERLVEIAVQEEIGTRDITRQIVKYADEEFE